MIVTSNSVQHEYTIPNLSIIGEVDGLENVAYQAQIYLHSSTTFDHTHDVVTYEDVPGSTTSTVETITEPKTLTEFTHYTVDLNTVGVSTDSFTAFDDLEEDQVIQWCLDADTDRIQEIQDKQEEKVLEAKDKFLNPRKYYRDTPVTPWRRRADEASAAGI